SIPNTATTGTVAALEFPSALSELVRQLFPACSLGHTLKNSANASASPPASFTARLVFSASALPRMAGSYSRPFLSSLFGASLRLPSRRLWPNTLTRPRKVNSREVSTPFARSPAWLAPFSTRKFFPPRFLQPRSFTFPAHRTLLRPFSCCPHWSLRSSLHAPLTVQFPDLLQTPLRSPTELPALFLDIGRALPEQKKSRMESIQSATILLC